MTPPTTLVPPPYGMTLAPFARREGQELADLAGVGRPRDGVRDCLEAPAPEGDPVGQALAPGVPDAILAIARDERVVRQPRLRDGGDDVRERCVRVSLTRADLGLEESERLRRQGRVGALVGPAVPAPHSHLLSRPS